MSREGSPREHVGEGRGSPSADRARGGRRRARATLAVLGLALPLVPPAPAQTVRQLTDSLNTVAGLGAMDDAGTTVFTGSSSNAAGGNPEHAYQVVSFDAATGAETRITAAEDGVSPLVSVSDDGTWIAFVAASDMTGTNHDQSLELFVIRADGTGLAQLTSDAAVNAGSVGTAVLSGDGSRIAFLANTDPLGTNASNLTQLFVVDRVGTGLAQLTSFIDPAASFGAVSISDDGARIVFAYGGDPLGTNADLGGELFAIEATGTSLRQLTTTAAGFASGAPALSGDGQKAAFQSDGDLTGGNAANQTEIFVVDWAGTGLLQLTTTTTIFGFTGDPASQAPSITDDGSTVFFQSNHSTLFVNLDSNSEIFRINTNGTGFQQVTSTVLELGSVFPTVSGNGNKIAFVAVDSAVNLQVADANGANQVVLVTYDTTFDSQPDVTPDGARIVFVRSTGLFGGDQVWRIEADGSGLAQVTALGSGGASSPNIAGDGQTIVFSAGSNDTGGNGDQSEEIFTIGADGIGLTQLTAGPLGTSSESPVIAADGSRVVFDSDADLTGGNADGSREIFTMLPDGTGLAQLTSGPALTASRNPRTDASGTVVAFESDADLDGSNADGSFEVWRVRTDGTGLTRLTGDPLLGSRLPDVSADGTTIVFVSEADLTGGNPDLNGEIFVYDGSTATMLQLTSFTAGSSGGARVSGDGAWVTFVSSAPVFESDPDEPVDLYRVPAAGGPIERIGALSAG
ncbi:MAG: hypothetical protein OEQ13_04445, partial [Acidobacteriota bacterium]|nr:hypothetical protein [Acidobacteriota bacterium]